MWWKIHFVLLNYKTFPLHKLQIDVFRKILVHDLAEQIIINYKQEIGRKALIIKNKILIHIYCILELKKYDNMLSKTIFFF